MPISPELVQTLQALVSSEASAIAQYTCHAAQARVWGYPKLHEADEARARGEMKHLGRLVDRLAVLGAAEGAVFLAVPDLATVVIGTTVPMQLEDDLAAEELAIADYQDAISLADRLADATTRTILEEILADEWEHAEYLRGELTSANQMSWSNYLSTLK